MQNLRMSRRHSMAATDNNPIDKNNFMTPTAVVISNYNKKKLITTSTRDAISTNNPIFDTKRMSRRNSADGTSTTTTTTTTTMNDYRMNHRITPPPSVAAAAAAVEIHDLTTEKEMTTVQVLMKTTRRKSRYPSSPFRRRRTTNNGPPITSKTTTTPSSSSNGPLLLSENVVSSLRQRRFISPTRCRKDKTVDNDEVPTKPQRKNCGTNFDYNDNAPATTITTTTTLNVIGGIKQPTAVDNRDRPISPIKRRRTPSRSPSASLRSGLSSMRDCLKPGTNDDCNSELKSIRESDTTKLHGVLHHHHHHHQQQQQQHHRNGMLPRKSILIDGERHVLFGTYNDDNDESFVLNISYCDPPEIATSDDERHSSYYSKDDLEKFDRDRQLTLLHFRNQRDKGIVWEEGEYSLRGLEEYVFTAKMKSRRVVRKEHLQGVLAEQSRLRLSDASTDIIEDSIRMVSLNYSKRDRTRALSLAAKDAKEAGHNLSGRHLIMKKFKSLSKRSLFRATGGGFGLDPNSIMSDSRRSLISDSRRSLMSDESSKISIASNATISEESNKSTSITTNTVPSSVAGTGRAVSPIKGQSSTGSVLVPPLDAIEATIVVVPVRAVQQSSVEHTYTTVRNQLRSLSSDGS